MLAQDIMAPNSPGEDRGVAYRRLIELFLTSEVYRAYAERFLLPEQIDAIDIARCLSNAAPPSRRRRNIKGSPPLNAVSPNNQGTSGGCAPQPEVGPRQDF